jgi:cell wall-associated NlpC family hydrolase
MTTVLPEATPMGPATAGRHRAPADATTGSMGLVPAERRSRSAHSSHRAPTAPLQRAARTGALSLAAIGALAGAGGVATHGLGDEAPTSGEMALPTNLAASNMSIGQTHQAVTAPAVMPVSSASMAKPEIKTASPASKAAAAKAAAQQAKAVANQKAAADRAAAASSVGARAVALAKSQIGVPYVWGGTSPSGFDCSGLMQWAFGKLGKDLPRTSSAQAVEGKKISESDLQPGDLVFMYSPVSHVAMYAGNGQIIEAPTEGEDVKMTPISKYEGKITGTRRL